MVVMDLMQQVKLFKKASNNNRKLRDRPDLSQKNAPIVLVGVQDSQGQSL